MQASQIHLNKLKENSLHILLCIFSVMIISLCFQDTINYDEYFSMSWCRLEWKSLMEYLIADVHPPLHYLLLKPILDLTGENIYCARLLSAIAGIILLWSGGLFMKKYFGTKASMFFICFTYLVPAIIQKSTEVRMYMVASLFTILSGIMSLLILKDAKRKNWLLFILFSLLAAYTHYYALLTMIFLYAGLLIYFIFTHDIKNMKAWFFYSLLTVIGYLPWLPAAWNQIISVNHDYWITMPGSRLGPLRELFSFYKFPYAHHVYLIVLMLLTIMALIFFLKDRNPENYWTLICFSALWGILAFSIWYASQIRPILVSRYLIMPLCLCILGISGTVRHLNKFFIIALCLFCALIGGSYYKNAFLSQTNRNTTKTIAFVNEHFSENDCILYFKDEYGYFAHCLEYYFPQADAIPIEDTEILYNHNEFSNEYDNVWFFDNIDYAANNTYMNGLAIEDWGRYGFSVTEFELYKIDF